MNTRTLPHSDVELDLVLASALALDEYISTHGTDEMATWRRMIDLDTLDVWYSATCVLGQTARTYLGEDASWTWFPKELRNMPGFNPCNEACASISGYALNSAWIEYLTDYLTDCLTDSL